MDSPARPGIRCPPETVPVYHRADNRTCRAVKRAIRGPNAKRRPKMEWLRRHAVALSEKVWKEIDELAAAMFKQTVVARRIVDFDGPRGWNHVATQLGTFKPAEPRPSLSKVRFSVPDVMLLTEIRAEFTLSWAHIDVFERVGPTLEGGDIEDAAREMALAEDSLVFLGSSFSPGLLSHRDSP